MNLSTIHVKITYLDVTLMQVYCEMCILLPINVNEGCMIVIVYNLFIRSLVL